MTLRERRSQRLSLRRVRVCFKYRIRLSKPPSTTWRAFLNKHVADLVSIDFLTIPTIKFKVLFLLVVLLHHRRKVIHFNVTGNPTAQRAAQQMVEAFPWDSAPKYLLRDRDIARGAGYVLDHDRLTPSLREFLADQATDDVRLTAGRPTDDQADRLLGVSHVRVAFS